MKIKRRFTSPLPHKRLAAEFMEKGAVIYSKGRIVGGTGLIIGDGEGKET